MGNLFQYEILKVGGPAYGKGLELYDPLSPFQTKPFHDSMKAFLISSTFKVILKGLILT